MMLRFDHLGVVVSDMAAGRDHFRLAFDITHWTEEFSDTINHVRVQFGRDHQGICYELIAPLGTESPILSALKHGSRILNHIAYLTENLDTAGARLCSMGYIPTGEAKPAVAYKGKRIQFFVSPLRFIVELIEAYEHRHEFDLSPPD